jgi:hemerythrin-like domain-containing protein
MKPRGLLMIEHRLIEKVLALADGKAAAMTEESQDPVFVDTVVDFIKTYADRTHHGKEEDILFAALERKSLGEVDARIMNELVEEHKQARGKVAQIVALNERAKRGERGTAGGIREIISWLASFYPVHIVKEDKTFFPDTERCFDGKELEEMLERFHAFDAAMIHEKYNKVFESLKT